MAFAIVTDTSANLPCTLAQQNDIHVIPLSYMISDTEHTCLDTDAFDAAAYYDSIRSGTRVTTSQISPQRYMEAWIPLLDAGEDVLYIGMSSGISGSFHSAQLAAEELQEDYPQRKIRLVDTLGASLGEGLPVLKAAEYRREGMDIDDVVEQIEPLCRRMCQIFVVEDLMYLRRGGRLSNVAAIAGTILHITPLLKGDEEGKIVTFGKIRGKRRALDALAQQYNRLVKQPQTQVIGIAHSNCPADAAYLINQLNRSRPPQKILTVDYEPVTGSYVGPGALALFFEGDDDVRAHAAMT